MRNLNLEGFGGGLNDALGVTNSSKRQFKYQMQLQKDAQNFSKWQMANAHQQEVQDLQKAGLNPVLSAGGSGASAGVTEGSASTGSASANPIDMLGTVVNMMNSAKQTDANIKQIEKDIEKTGNDIKNNTNLTNAQIRNLDANTEKTEQNTELDEPDEEVAKALKWFNSTWVGKGVNVLGHAMNRLSPFTSPVIQYQGAKRIATEIGKPKTEVINTYNSKGDLIKSKTKTKNK